MTSRSRKRKLIQIKSNEYNPSKKHKQTNNSKLKEPMLRSEPNFNLGLDDDDSITEVFRRKPFAEGAFRYAYAGLINRGARRGDKVVIKKWKSAHIFDKNFWDNDLKCYKKAKQLIDIWNDIDNGMEIYEISIPRKRICLNSGSSKTLCNIPSDEVVKNEYLIVEDYLRGEFTKWNSNSGFVQEDKLSIQAFCHWTYHHTKGQLIMCDAQGVKSKYKYQITDPCICSTSKLYGSTDCGIKGIHSFFSNHKCNEYCDKKWMKPLWINPINILPKRQTSTYVWEI